MNLDNSESINNRNNQNSEKNLLLKNSSFCQSYKSLESQYIKNKTLTNYTNDNKFSDTLNKNILDSLRNENFLLEQKQKNSINFRMPIPAAPNKNSKTKYTLSKGKFPNYSISKKKFKFKNINKHLLNNN
jgi:hypothetical protein